MYYIVTYANKKFINSIDYLEQSLKTYDVKLLKYTDADLPPSFRSSQKKHFKVTRGGGYWVWKPYIILDALSKINHNDMLLYMDSGVAAIDDVTILFNYFNNLNQDIVLFQNHGLQNQSWTKRDCFILMGCDNDHFYYKDQINAALQLYKNNINSIKFLNEYLEFCKNYDIISDNVSKIKPNFISFVEHRHDQSILTNLAIKYNFKVFRNPTQFGNHFLDDAFISDNTMYTYGFKKFKVPFPDSNYPQIFDHHRRRFNFKDTIIKKIVLKIYNFIK